MNAFTGYVVGRNGTILRTDDGGLNWVAEVSGTGRHLRGVHFPVHECTGYAVGDNGTILKNVCNRPIPNMIDWQEQ
jgi:photosystem II stability/assembly factor-like uncharacterized protein